MFPDLTTIQNLGAWLEIVQHSRIIYRKIFKKEIEEIKPAIRILFIDDEYDTYPLIDTLKTNMWDVSTIEDIDNIHHSIVKSSHIVFVDRHDVGVKLRLENEGLDLTKALKREYGNRKKIIIYSSDSSGNIFDEALNISDWSMEKDRRTTDVLAKVKEFAEDLYYEGILKQYKGKGNS